MLRDTDLLFARLDMNFDQRALYDESVLAAQLPDAQPHHQELRSLSGKPDNKLRRGASRYHTGGWVVCADMMRESVKARFPYCASVMAAMPAPVMRCRILGLQPGHRILPHVGNLEEREICRIHVAMVTHPLARMFAVDESVHLKPGECWYLNQTRTHWVENDSDVFRLHLTIDIEPTAAVETWISKALVRLRKPRLAQEE